MMKGGRKENKQPAQSANPLHRAEGTGSPVPHDAQYSAAPTTAAPSPDPGAGSKAKQVLRLMITNFFKHNVGRSGAALAYYLLFALFPILIFVSTLLGQLNLDIASITQALASVLPRDVLELLASYLEHVSRTSSSSLLGFSLAFTLFFPLRATKGLMYDVRRAYNLPEPRRAVSYAVRQMVYTLVLFVVLALTLLLSTLGPSVVEYIVGLVPWLSTLHVPVFLVELWRYLRFLLMGLIMFAALGALYAMSQDQRQPISAILPGAVTALIAWLAVSMGFSFYVENFANYSIIYGTLGTVIVLLLWLYMTAVILILGAELNAALRTVRSNKGSEINLAQEM